MKFQIVIKYEVSNCYITISDKTPLLSNFSLLMQNMKKKSFLIQLKRISLQKSCIIK